jgi:LCP family protein required for cell wall assembly
VETNSPSSSQAESATPRVEAPPTETPEAGASTPAYRALKSPLFAATLSFVFPGAGQLYLGRRLSAVVFAVPALVAVLWAVLQLSHGLLYFAVSMLDDDFALTIMVVAAAFTAWRVASIAHPFLVVRPRRIGLRAGAGLALLLIATLGMGDVVFSNAFAAYSAVRQIASNDFADATAPPTPLVLTPDPSPTLVPTDSGSPPPSASPEITPSPNPCDASDAAQRVASNGFADAAALPMALVLTPDPNPTPTPTDSASPPPSATPEITPSPSATSEISPSPSPTLAPTDSGSPPPSATPEITPSPSPTWGPNPNRLTVLLTGVDFMQGRSHALNDSLMLVSVDTRTRAVAMVSVPRDTSAFPFYWGGQAPDTFKINGLVKAIAAGQFGSPDPPTTTLANEIGWLVGVPVDYYAVIDMDGFSQMIDLVGGVDVYNPALLDDPFTCTYVPAGPVHLDGPTALKYARSRESTNDYQRASRQQTVLVALEKKMATPAMLPKLGSLLALAGKSIATNFPLDTARNYVDTVENISSISRCVLGPPYNYHPDSSFTNGTWTSRLNLDQVATLSVQLFGTDSRYYGQPGVGPAPCQNRS